jgi:FAD dependent oxidoreductase
LSGRTTEKARVASARRSIDRLSRSRGVLSTARPVALHMQPALASPPRNERPDEHRDFTFDDGIGLALDIHGSDRDDKTLGVAGWLRRKKPAKRKADLAGAARALNDHALVRDIETEVLILGAGITGAVIADVLADAGLKVTVVDRRGAAKGSTAANTALVQYEIDTPLITLTRKIGKEKAVRAPGGAHASPLMRWQRVWANSNSKVLCGAILSICQEMFSTNRRCFANTRRGLRPDCRAAF